MFFVFLALWIIFNGTITLEVVLVGAAISALLYAFVCRFMEYSPKKDWQGFKNLGRVLRYVVTLVWEIVKANTQVIHFILTSKYEIEPMLIRFRTDLKKEGNRAVLANSITLTPGTITVALTGDELLVHCLDKELAEGMEESTFVKQLRALEEEK